MHAPDTQMGLAFPRRVLSYGGGLDSFAMLLDAIERGDKPELVVFCDVADGSPERDPGDPGEWSGTYRHVREIVIPLCRREKIEFVWLDTTRYPVRDAGSLFAWMWQRGQIPVAGPDRLCTTIAKVERFERFMNDRFPGERVEVWIGFDAAELARVEKDPNTGSGKAQKRKILFTRSNRFPLIERGLCRCRCLELVRRLGYPVPRKSACVFCPYASLRDWQTLARQDPGTFAKIAELEARKPPTSSGKKLSIMGYKTKKDPETGAAIGYRAPRSRSTSRASRERSANPVACAELRSGRPKRPAATGSRYLARPPRRSAERTATGGSMATVKKVHTMHDPREIARALLRGVQVGVDGAGRARVIIDKDLSDEDIAAIVDALPTVHRRMLKRLGRGRTALH